MCVMIINNSPSARKSLINNLKYQLYFCRTWSILQVLQIKPATNFIYKRINKYMCTWISAKFISKRLKLFVCDRQNGYCHQQGVEKNGVKSHITTMVISAGALIKVKEDVCLYIAIIPVPYTNHYSGSLIRLYFKDIRGSTRQSVMHTHGGCVLYGWRMKLYLGFYYHCARIW